VSAVVVLPLTWLDSVAYLARISFVALIALMVGFGFIFYYGAEEYGFPSSGSGPGSFSEVVLVRVVPSSRSVSVDPVCQRIP
jgi:hypothetical protein